VLVVFPIKNPTNPGGWWGATYEEFHLGFYKSSISPLLRGRFNRPPTPMDQPNTWTCVKKFDVQMYALWFWIKVRHHEN
jgi:hypothetical protein